MPFKNGNYHYREHVWTKEELNFIKSVFHKMTTVQLAKELGLGIATVRKKCTELGLKHMEMEYWTEEQIKFLKENYKQIGDLELSEIFNSKWPKKKGWTNKHIEKKRMYLKLKRTRSQIIAIGQRNLDQGRLNAHMNKGNSNFLTIGPARQKEIRMYRSSAGVITSRIKIGKRWVYWPRWAWVQKNGPVPAGMVVVMKDDNPFNTRVTNLEIVTRSESTRRYAAKTSINLSDKYVLSQLSGHNKEVSELLADKPELIESYRAVLLLKRKVRKLKAEASRNGKNIHAL
jgi:hypothetical protein